MKKNRFLVLPGGIVVLGGKQKRFSSASNNGFFVDIDDFEFVICDPVTGTQVSMNGDEEIRFSARYSFASDKAGCMLFTVESDLAHMALIDAIVEGAIKDLPVDATEVAISLTEIVHNAFQVAEERSVKKDIQVTLLYVPQRKCLVVSITDELGRLNLDALPHSFCEADGSVSMSEHGRGFLIIGLLMEAIAYNPSDNGYKEIVIKVPFLTRKRER